MKFGGKKLMEKEDLELRLSSSACGDRHWVELNLMPASFSSSSSCFFSEKKNIWMDVSGSSEKSLEVYTGIDVNKIPSMTIDVEEEAATSSPNSTVSSISGKRNERDQNGEENELEKASSRGISDEEDGDGSRKKLRLSKEQSLVLEESFREHNTLTPKQKFSLAKQLNLRPRQVEVWFQNRRARTKLKQTEVDCEFLKRRCERLTEENRRLHKEIQELKTLKFSPQFYMQMNPLTTLTTCSSCEHVAVASPDSDQSHSLPVNSIFPSIGNHRRSSATTSLSACLQTPIHTLNVLPP